MYFIIYIIGFFILSWNLHSILEKIEEKYGRVWATAFFALTLFINLIYLVGFGIIYIKLTFVK